MSIISDCLIHTITVWKQEGLRGDGNPKFSDPRQIKARWVDTNQLFTDNTGREVNSNAMVYSEEVLPVGSWVYKGVAYDAIPNSKAWEVKNVKESPSLKGDDSVVRHML